MKLVKMLTFDFDQLLELFPFPLSSPQLPGTSAKEVDRWLNGLGDHPLAQDMEGSTDILFFNDSDHFKQYYENRRYKFCEQTIHDRKSAIVLLLQGDLSMKLPPAALWLKSQRRLDVKKTRPTLLANFLGNALFLFNPDFDQPRALARKELEILRDRFTDRGDRATARKKGVCGKVSGDVSTVGRVQIPLQNHSSLLRPKRKEADLSA